MGDSSETTRANRQYVLKCLKCDHYIPADASQCPHCGSYIAPGTVEVDFTMPPITGPIPQDFVPARKNTFAPDASAMLHIMPLGVCLSMTLRKPLILGRGLTDDVEKLLDLSDFRGLEHGVSREHCQLQRRGSQLVATDLGSTNGTFLNGHLMQPFKEQVIAHGDRLILGTLQILVLFSSER